ncbi:MAG: hypothetical protein ACI8RD_002640, partial [Bacillariaceae sp.]
KDSKTIIIPTNQNIRRSNTFIYLFTKISLSKCMAHAHCSFRICPQKNVEYYDMATMDTQCKAQNRALNRL